jgi:phage tail-like protein
MQQPTFAHLTGAAMWRHCDFDRARIAADPARVMLAPQEIPPPAAADPAHWSAARGGAAVLPCPPDLCQDAAVVLADPAHGLFALSRPEDQSSAVWRPLPAPRPRVYAPAPGAFDFAPIDTPTAEPSPPAGIARDRSGRVWLLDRSPPGLRVLSPDLTLLDAQPLPPAAIPTQVACCSWCVAVDNGDQLQVQPFGAAWTTVALPAAAIAIAGDTHFDLVAALLPGPKLAVLKQAGLTIHDLPELSAPLFLLVTGPDTVLAGEPRAAPGSTTEARFVSFKLDPSAGPTAIASYAVRGFDGRALWRDDDTVWASTAAGARALYQREAPIETVGAVETFALDSAIFACAWHRVFVDACVPPGTSVTLEAKTADDLPPFPVRRPLRPPADISAPVLPVAIDDPWLPLGSLVADEPGWSPIGVLDVRGAQADIPDPPERIVRPSEDPFAQERSTAIAPWPQLTLEGLIKATPGRYLWLRIRLTGTERRSPAVLAVRASFPRPSLLDSLPAYWRADPIAADATTRALALFEGWYTETDARITILRELAEPDLAPPEALDWLASFVAITFDQRIDEAVRRQLLSEACWLYERRGTTPGLTRLLSILAQAPVIIVESFRQRRQAGAFIGASASVVGPGLQLGDDEAGSAAEDPADVALERDYTALLLRRAAAIRADGGEPCPADDPPYPLETDPYARFVRRFAHRFTVVLPCARTDTLEGVIQDAVEANKPAHTLHDLCWLDAGFRLGASSLVGLSRLGETPCFEPGLLGAAVLGVSNTLGRYEPDGRFRTGQRLIRERTHRP